MTESRLEKLLKLIDTAQSPAYRRLAAKQLGSLVQSQPNQARPLLKMLDKMIYSKSWDTRIACGYAIEYIFTSLPAQFIQLLDNLNESELLKEMDLQTEIRSRKVLLSSAGSEFDLDLTISAAERLKISRANVKKTLGFDEISVMEELERELVKDEDLNAVAATAITTPTPAVPAVDLEKLSARERIAMKRKARLKSQAPPAKQIKKSEDSIASSSVAGSSDNLSVIDNLESIESDAVWFCEKMKEKLLNPNWQVRHGALLGLRGVLGRGIPILNSSDGAIISESQEGWIDFLLCDILLVLGLDRFKDFLGDQVASPVKETSAQLLSLVYKRLGSEKQTCLVSRHLRALMNFEHWEVRHAGLLSLKHILANVSNVEIACQLSDRVVDLLSDGDEDVRSVAADVLCTLLSSGRQESIDLARTFRTIQGLLEGLDELGPSTVPILDLLVQLVGLNSSFSVESSLLLPFLRNASTKVRKQVIKVLGAMTESDNEEQVKKVLIQLIQSMAVELDREINDLTLGLVLDLLMISSIKISEVEFDKLFEIVTCPLGQIYDKKNFSVEVAVHDLGFKKADMMVISEEEGIIQRLNLSFALSAIVATVEFNIDKYKEKLIKSDWLIHHLIYRWIFGPETDQIDELKFNELSGLTGTLQFELNRFIQACGNSTSVNSGHISSSNSSSNSSVNTTALITSAHNMIKEFNTRSEKSVEGLNQLAVLETVLKQFEVENEKLNARLSVCQSDSYVLMLKALKIETNSRLQEFYAKELVKILEKEEDKVEIELLREFGEFLDLRRLSQFTNDQEDVVINVQRDWIEHDRRDDHLWKSGKFIFKELSKSAIIVGKSFNNLKIVTAEDYNWLTGIFIEIQSKEIAFLVNVTLKDLKFSGCRCPLEISSSALIFASLVRLEIISKGNSKSLEQFINEILFKSGAKEIFPVILELLNRCAEGILPIVPVFLKRTLMEINDSDLITRKFASLTFSQLVKIAPLSVKVEGLSQETEKLIGECREFLDQLQGPSTALPDFVTPCPLNVEMRPYQQAGLNWLAFLRKFNLHGALCDDMGLGKTLQTLSIIASDHFEQKSKDGLRSLIVCPASLTGHWEAEVRQYCPSLDAPLLYVGPSAFRHAQLYKKLSGAEIVVTSYDVLRSDAEQFAALHWNYCVLDEGHLIKNPKTKLSAAVKGLKAKRRLLLSGTPIQNNLLELWALFDFLLPGYLGSEKEFTEKYAKPILILQHQQSVSGTSTTLSSTPPDSSIGKWTQKDFDEAEAKLQSLHKQVLPFILRRMKEDVLADLPPKIIQDYKCPMSSIQKMLYDELLKGSNVKSEISKFVKEKFKEEIIASTDTEGAEESDDIKNSANSSVKASQQMTSSKPTHVFQVLQYLRKLCVHPSLVLTENDPMMPEINSELLKNNLKMTDLSVAPKFQMLKELLVECGLGNEENEVSSEGNHRVLIFAQHKSTLDLIEELVFKPHLSNISYLRLDGSVEASARYPIVSKFNSDMTIDVLLLTTHVGGLGLNLTTADTVIFMDPDWNPMKDLQAMDRAHRLGQKRVVTVYRLLLQDTLEDRIMSLQRWKTRVAGTVITQQNSEAINHENLLDLFDEDEDDQDKAKAKAKGLTTEQQKAKKKSSDKSVPDWHNEDDSDLAAREAEYEQEFKSSSK